MVYDIWFDFGGIDDGDQFCLMDFNGDDGIIN